jgi:hypothetical protein
MKRVSRNAIVYSLPIAAAASHRHLLTPRLSFSDEPSKKTSFYGLIDKARQKFSSLEKPASSSAPTPSAYSDYTLDIISGLKNTLGKHENKLREKASFHESNIREALSFHRKRIEELATSLTDVSDLFDIVPASILDDKTKSSLRDVSAACEKIISQYQRTVTTFNHPFLVNLGILRLYSMQQQPRQLVASSLSRRSTNPRGGHEEDDADRDVFLAEVRHFLRFSDDVYEDKSTLYLSSSDIIARELDARLPVEGGNGGILKHPSYVVFLDHLTQSLVVVIRGTASVSDIITDLHCSTRCVSSAFILGNLSLHAICNGAVACPRACACADVSGPSSTTRCTPTQALQPLRRCCFRKCRPLSAQDRR